MGLDLNISYLDEFCGSEFWNVSTTWHTPDPDLTLCFEKTVLVWIPCALLWLLSGLDLFYIVNSKKRNVPWNWRNISKLTLTGTLTLLTLIDVVTVVLTDRTVYSADVYPPLVKILSFALSGILIYYNRKHGMHTSGVLFIFWFFLSLCGAPQFRTEIRKAQRDEISPENYQSHTVYLIYYPIVLLIFLLNCLADKPPTESQYPKAERPCPEVTASFLSRLFFSWFDGLILKGFKKPLEPADLWDMNHEDSSRELVPKFEKHWQNSLKKCQGYNSSIPKNTPMEIKFNNGSGQVNFVHKPKKREASVLTAIIKTFGPMYMFAVTLKIFQDVLVFVNPQVLGLIITYVREDQETWKGYVYAALLFCTAMTQTIFQANYLKRAFTMGMRIRSVLVSVIYKKALTISNAARRERTVGEIVNLMTVDAQKFQELANQINQLWSAPLQISLSLYFLWQELGPSVLAGLGIMIILIPINGVIANKNKKLHMKQMKCKDQRVKAMSEILNGIRVLKLYAWEPSFEKQVQKIRNTEIKILTHASYLHAGSSFILQCAPFLVSLATFATYVLIDENNILDANKAYVSLSLFNIMRMPLNQLPNLISQLIQTVVSVKRLNKFMNADDLDPNNVYHEPNKEYPLTIENGTFSWGDDPILKNLDIQLKANSLTAVVGSVGSGKSTLISAFLGETERVFGRVNTFGTIAYVSQQAWIQNATLKDNITFGKSFDKDLYDKAVWACALKPDLEMLPGGDLTEIGEKGINLSGGQKQRVSLARAVYANADIYFLDDPLSAVDSHVGKHIFEHVIGPKGILAKKTKLLVTHGITYLPQTDQIIVMKDGEVSESGTYQQLLSRRGAFAELLLQHISDDAADEELDELKDQLTDTPLKEEVTNRLSRRRSQVSESESVKVQNGVLKRQISTNSMKGKTKQGDVPETKKGGAGATKRSGKKLIETERAETGNVRLEVYKYYFKTIGFHLMAGVMGLNLINQGFQVGSNVWLGLWADDSQIYVNGSVDTARRDMYLGGYGVFGFGQVVAIVTAHLLFTKITLDAAVKIHDFLLNNVMRLPMAFFDVTPMGRILARFSNDLNGVDLRLPGTLQGIMNRIIQIIGTVTVIVYTTPLFIAVFLPISVLYVIMQRLYVSTSRQLKRLESVSRSPIYSHFGETVTGVQAIRAFSQQDRFILESEKKIDLNQTCHYPSIIANRWVSVRLEMMGNFIILSAALFCVVGKNTAPAMVGLTISYALQITQTLNFVVRMSSEVETNIVSVERIKEYGGVPQEAAWELANNNPPKSWPEIGSVEFKDYAVRYRPGLDLVLKGISFYILGGEKIGIVGRTGAGKSSLTLALFRIIESSSGHISIDNINIAEIGLHTLRSRLTIIPQDAVLFSGSLRMNLDPFDDHKDEEVWAALDHAHLRPFVKGLAAGLQHEVAEGGDNLSVGQRQLICLARALLRKTKLLILDEATAAVDLETDDLIQRTIRTEFKDCTVITIAHRLNTILDSDRVIVLDKGQIAEYDTPANLLADPNSIFSGMHKDAGLS